MSNFRCSLHSKADFSKDLSVSKHFKPVATGFHGAQIPNTVLQVLPQSGHHFKVSVEINLPLRETSYQWLQPVAFYRVCPGWTQDDSYGV